MQEVETVLEHCKHKDCIYRSYINGGVPICYYAVMEQQPRGCKISECTKYARGERKRPKITALYEFLWETEIYDEDVDALRKAAERYE